jgi:hypothetical protein
MKFYEIKTSAISLFAVILIGISAPATAGEEVTVQAFAPWQGQGTIYRTGEKTATFVGALAGRFYVETDEGPLDAGVIVCPTTLEFNAEDGTQTGHGRCAIAANDIDRIFASFSCAGVHLVGCKGDFKLSGGVGRFKGITGGGPITVRRSGAAKVEATVPGHQVDEGASGIIYWRKFQYKLP